MSVFLTHHTQSKNSKFCPFRRYLFLKQLRDVTELSDGCVLPDGVGHGEEIGGRSFGEHLVSSLKVEDLEHRLRLPIGRGTGSGRRRSHRRRLDRPVKLLVELLALGYNF